MTPLLMLWMEDEPEWGTTGDLSDYLFFKDIYLFKTYGEKVSACLLFSS